MQVTQKVAYNAASTQTCWLPARNPDNSFRAFMGPDGANLLHTINMNEYTLKTEHEMPNALLYIVFNTI